MNNITLFDKLKIKLKGVVVMSVKVDRKNKVIIGETKFKNKKIRAIARCHDGDEFDEKFGRKLVNKKLKIKREIARINYHDSMSRKLNREIKKKTAESLEHEKIADRIEISIKRLINECSEFVNNKYKN